MLAGHQIFGSSEETAAVAGYFWGPGFGNREIGFFRPAGIPQEELSSDPLARKVARLIADQKIVIGFRAGWNLVPARWETEVF